MTQKKKMLLITVLVLVIFLGFGIIIFPIISALYSDQNHTAVIREYSEDINSLTEQAKDETIEKARAYNRVLVSSVRGVDPFSKSFHTDINTNYDDLLNFNSDGIMGYIEIPAIEVYLPIYHGTDDEVLSKGAGHLLNSSLPVGGLSTHTIISAHTGLPKAEMFNHLTKLQKGDVFYLHVLDLVMEYEVEETLIVKPSEFQKLQIEEGKDRCTLITCYPYGVNSHRLLVRGLRTSYEPSQIAAGDYVIPKETVDVLLYIIIFSVMFFIIVIVVCLRIRRRRDEKNA